MKKYLILTIALLTSISMTYAQDEDFDDESTGYGASAGDFTGAILFGRGTFLKSQSPPGSPKNSTNWTVSGSAPASQFDINTNNANNIIGGEVRYFVTDKIAVKVSGGAIIDNSPGLQNVQYFGNSDEAGNTTWIPQYGTIVETNNAQANINIGGEYHFPSSRFDRLFPYLGVTMNYYYSSKAQYDPTVFYGSTSTTQNPIDDGIIIYDVGVRSAVVQGIGGQAVAGIDVYIIPGMYFGIETKPVSYLYQWNAKLPGSGLSNLEAETNSWSFFSQTFLKIGFIVGKL